LRRRNSLRLRVIWLGKKPVGTGMHALRTSFAVMKRERRNRINIPESNTNNNGQMALRRCLVLQKAEKESENLKGSERDD